ncbi:OmpA family protein [Hyphomonas sp.]|uniref:OmpA family protein n=1 Tax=Hyphomonas sp. TaxID=87 RepID=UPI0032F048BA
MVHRDRKLARIVASFALMGLAACGGEKADEVIASPAGNDAECVSIAEGLYVFENGKFTAAAAPAPQVVERVTRASTGWVGEIERALAAAGYPWMGIVARENVATLTGLAPDPDAKRRAVEIGTSALESDPIGSAEITLIVDGIGVESGERGVGESLAALAQGGISEATCQQALNQTMEGQKVYFPTNRSDISPVSAGLLDAVAGISMLCDAYAIEIGSHTDSRGSDEYNLVLSQKRADAIRQYLLEKGVAIDQLTAIGFGESMPLDKADTPESRERNVRTEFRISRRPE